MISSDVNDIVLCRVILRSEFVYTICKIPDGGPLEQVLIAADVCIR